MKLYSIFTYQLGYQIERIPKILSNNCWWDYWEIGTVTSYWCRSSVHLKFPVCLFMITSSSLLPEVITVQDFVLAISLLKVVQQVLMSPTCARYWGYVYFCYGCFNLYIKEILLSVIFCDMHFFQLRSVFMIQPCSCIQVILVFFPLLSCILIYKYAVVYLFCRYLVPPLFFGYYKQCPWTFVCLQ